MILDLTDEEHAGAAQPADRGDRGRPLPAVAARPVLREILAKFGELGGLSPDLAEKLRRHAPAPPAKRPSPEECDPGRAPRQGRRSR
jgi:hypothetical protein